MSDLKLSYLQLAHLCQTVQPRMQKANCLGFVQKTSQEFYLLFKKKEQTEALFFSFVSPLIGFYLVKRLPARLQQQQTLFSFLNGSIIQSIELLNQDRILQITFQTSHGEFFLIAEFFNKHPNFYLVQATASIQWSLYPVTASSYYLPQALPSISNHQPFLSHEEVEQAYLKQKLIQEKTLLTLQATRQLKQLNQKLKVLKQAIQNCESWQQVQLEGELIKAYFSSYPQGKTEWWVENWETNTNYCLVLDPFQTAQEAMKHRFRQAKKLQMGRLPLEKQLNYIQQKIDQTEQTLHQLEQVKSLNEIKIFKNQELTVSAHSIKNAPSTISKIYREYRSANGIKIWVGRNAKMNEALTFKLARGNEWWMHVNNFPGSHVIIRQASDQPPDTHTLQDAMQLALHYSKAKEEAEICYTQCKYVSRLKKGQTGQVQISKHQLAWVQKDQARYQALIERLKS
jgi:predicted ribosome quality control (RQC) complex YloA/Tae2 family protein